MPLYSREYPRFATDLPIEIVPPAGDVIHVHGVNISRAGLQIICDGSTASLMAGEHPERGGIPQGAHNRLRIPLAWPGRGGLVIEVDCQLIFVRRESASRFTVGLNFKQFVGDGEAVMEDYASWLISRPEHPQFGLG